MEYNDEILYKLWLNILCGHNPSIVNKCIKSFGSAEDIFKSDTLFEKMLSSLKFSLKLKAKRSLDSARQLLNHCEENGIKIIAFGDKLYPKRLSQIFSPPQILYVKGEMPDFDRLVCISVVGSRNCSEYSRDFSYRLARDLTKSGILVISGMARGIDSSAHNGALDAGGITSAVLAGGVDVVYPKSNKALYDDIIECGAVISERPPGTVGRANFYKERNRIIVGLSNGVIIVEGEAKSGTKLTADWAISSNRDLFAVPGKPDDKGAELPNRLIKDSARLITSAEDVVGEYISVYPTELKHGIALIDENRERKSSSKRRTTYNTMDIIPKADKPSFDSFDGKQRIILQYLYKTNTTVHIDEISRDCDIDITELSFLIIQLLMAGVIKEHPGEYYSII